MSDLQAAKLHQWGDSWFYCGCQSNVPIPIGVGVGIGIGIEPEKGIPTPIQVYDVSQAD